MYVFENQEPREVYIADTENHCIRKLVVRQANVETVAGICGTPGFEDGLLSVNKLNKPSMIGLDKIGNIFIYDSGNRKLRMIDTNGEMFTLIDGACREDNTMPPLDPPFDLEIRGTVCYKRWRTIIPMENFNYEPEEEVAEEEEEVVIEGEDGEEMEEAEEVVDVFIDECLQTHPVLCKSATPHPLVRERNKYY